MKKINGEEVVVKCFSPEYEEQVIEHLVDITGGEFGFKEWENHYRSKGFLYISEKEEFWIAINNKNEVIGTMGLMQDKFDENAAKLHSVYVNKYYRGTGVADKLLKTAIDFAEKCGYNKIILSTSNDFPAGIRFYEKNGFTISKSIKSQNGIWYEKNLKQNKWNDYFANIRNKYSMRVSKTKPLIIDLDGKNVTSNAMYSLLDNQKGSFLDIVEQVVKKITYEYECMAIFGVDEISFIFDSATGIIDKINNNKNYKSDEIISIFSQYFFNEFNNLNSKTTIFWHGKCYSIEENKKISYIKYKSQSILNVFLAYFLKKNGIKDAGNIKLYKKLELCNKIDFFKDVEQYSKGILYYKGKRIDLDEYLKGNIKQIGEVKKQPQIKFLDLNEFNN